MQWIGNDRSKIIVERLKITHMKEIELSIQILKKRVCNHMLRNYDINTHSLRYAYVDYMYHERGIPLTTIADTIGHVKVDQLLAHIPPKPDSDEDSNEDEESY